MKTSILALLFYISLEVYTKFGKVSDSHLLFLRRFDVPFVDNMSERDLRKVKNRQKMSGGFRDESGRDMFCTILSFIETCKRRSLPVFQSICAALSGDRLLGW